MSFWERDDGRRWCACFQVWQPPSDTRTCEAGGCPELRSVTECRHCGHTVNEHTTQGCTQPGWACRCPYTRNELLEVGP